MVPKHHRLKKQSLLEGSHFLISTLSGKLQESWCKCGTGTRLDIERNRIKLRVENKP